MHDPLVWREAADTFLTQAGVQVLFHATVTGALVEGGERVEGISVWTKQGRIEVRAKIVVDASGDADVVAMAGLPSFIGDDGRVQNPTMIFRLLGVDTARFLAEYGDDTIMPARITELMHAAQRRGLRSSRAPRSGCSPRRVPASCCATAPASSGRTDAS